MDKSSIRFTSYIQPYLPDVYKWVSNTSLTCFLHLRTKRYFILRNYVTLFKMPAVLIFKSFISHKLKLLVLWNNVQLDVTMSIISSAKRYPICYVQWGCLIEPFSTQ